MTTNLYPQPDEPENTTNSDSVVEKAPHQEVSIQSTEPTKPNEQNNEGSAPINNTPPEFEPRLKDNTPEPVPIPPFDELLPQATYNDNPEIASPLPEVSDLHGSELDSSEIKPAEPDNDIGIIDGPIAKISEETANASLNDTVVPTPPIQEEAIQEHKDSTETSNPEQNEDPGSVTPSVSGLQSFWPRHKTTLWLFLPILLVILMGFILSAMYPTIIALITRALLALVFVVIAIFIILGVLVVIGLRDQAKGLLSLLFEGGLQYINLAQSLSEIWSTIVRIVQEFILLIAPFLAIFLAILFYYIVMFLFRAVGAETDITLFTIILTIVLASITAILGQISFDGTGKSTFQSQLSRRFSRVFVDSIEVVVLVIFLTIDIENFIILPQSFHVPLEASAFGIDFMQRGFTGEGLGLTVQIAGAAIFVEIVRKAYRMIYSTYKSFKEQRMEMEAQGKHFKNQREAFDLLRSAAHSAYRTNLDDLLKFLGFTTILVFAFFFFPRLKLLSLLFFNLTMLGWDIAVPSRITKKARNEDLLSRLIAKVLKL